jgi:hypothetical protein
MERTFWRKGSGSLTIVPRRQTGLLISRAPSLNLSRIRQILGASLLAGWFLSAVPENAGGVEILGWMEKAMLNPGGVILPAKLDTGADHSSLDADDVTMIQKEGRQWVRFTVTAPDGRRTILERPFVRTAFIKGRSRDLGRRPVVLMGICVGGVVKEVQVNLTDRSHFRCPLIIGRSFLAGSVIVDPGRRYTREITCMEGKRP